jgi:hypothetical protein
MDIQRMRAEQRRADKISLDFVILLHDEQS